MSISVLKTGVNRGKCKNVSRAYNCRHFPRKANSYPRDCFSESIILANRNDTVSLHRSVSGKLNFATVVGI